MIGKFFSVWAIVKRIDSEDIKALKEFVILFKDKGKTIVEAVSLIKDKLDELIEELQD